MGNLSSEIRTECRSFWTSPVEFRLLRLTAVLVLALALSAPIAAGQEAAEHPIALVIHGGAGGITPETLGAEAQAQYREALQAALDAGYEVLDAGGSSLDAVTASITAMEDSPLFNAARGAVLTSAGTAELDASIMDGRNRRAGAVASVKRVRNPILLARSIMEVSPHVMLVGEGAEAFATEQNLELVDNEYFRTPRRVEQYERYRQETGEMLLPEELRELRKYGTVGAVALDADGNLAAGTSTGGISFKRWGRVGDSPIIGAGTYADNATCAVSATGDGEYFIRGVAAHSIAAAMRYGGLPLEEAAAAVIHGTIPALGGDGGVIALDRQGHMVMTFTTAGMFRGYVAPDGTSEIAMFGD